MVVTDLNMPVMSGLDFIEAARAEPAGQGVPIFLLTTEMAPELQTRARAVQRDRLDPQAARRRAAARAHRAK